ncbi:DAK2 domain-containing protein [Paenactinomyces guangxiensis]|uniref:DAK2 domain-containing protein n=2 Tax=Paenactinomyces guangxiensis TaxID=1490290 RepID=A0A7W1WRI7_9BACL|nr:DAK2 domain-containing protein [Paenactinomyces guangxiensis]MBA4494754.1 DAK2 domain-containing protein [Paenactinomyces guangxiensis]MBH8591838.1 DAK2 domain-containing protein [Paenactinomyces guangxiensis]
MMRAGAKNLDKHVETVNALNVFPVPDGDTGTNMNLTLTSGVKEMEKVRETKTVGKLAEALSKGLLMGARGNSGVILSQLFRGFAKAVSDKSVINPRQLSDAFQRGVETAYKAVIKPVEGTILTVSREAAEAGMKRSWGQEDPVDVMEAVVNEARRSLARTPEKLPVLKQTGVVDAGGQGLVFIYEGMLSVLKGDVAVEEDLAADLPDLDSIASMAHEQNAQAKLDPSQIEHGYCTEFIVQLKTDRRKTKEFDENQFRREMGRFGDSLLVVADDELVKVHIHAEYPGDALNFAMAYGDLTRIKIDNMREQYEHVTEGKTTVRPVQGAEEEEETGKPDKKYGVVAVAAGEGIANIFRSLGVDVVIEGGQTMNPSTEDIVKAIEQISAEHILVLPNNKNIILTAEQVSEVLNTPITVLPTRTVPQGLAALLAFSPEETPESNKQKMIEAYSHVQSGELTYAIRDSNMNGMEIKEGDFLGIREGKIEKVGRDMIETACGLLETMLGDGADVVTVICGKDVTEAQVKEVSDFIENKYPDTELEVHDGGQPLYYFLFSVE